jgi:hypothetical protein
MSYFVAVSSACSTGALIRMATAPYLKTAHGARLVVMNAVTTMLSCAVGGWCNNYVMRAPETKLGISIQDPNSGDIVGVSKKCANAARWQTANSRVAMALPMLFPAAVMMALEKMKICPKGGLSLEALKVTLLTI